MKMEKPRGIWAMPSWHRQDVHDFGWQALLLLSAAGAIVFFARNAAMHGSFAQVGLIEFLVQPASFDIGVNLAGFRPGDPTYMAYLAGIANTALVSGFAIGFSTLLGTVVGLSRLSSNPLLRSLARLYVECIRNVPLLVQLLLWYALLTKSLPGPRQALHPIGGVFFSNRGMNIPALELAGATEASARMVLLACLATALLGLGFASKPAVRRWLFAIVTVAAVAGAVLLLSTEFRVSVPELKGFNFVGGLSVSPEFVAVLAGLSIYSAAFIAETIRGGILGVGAGQREAGRSLGLRPWHVTWLVVFPQALRNILPPLCSQYVSIVKNSSLAVAVGYPELVRVSVVVMSETGRAITVMGLLMAVYLSFSLLIAWLMSRYEESGKQA